MRGKQLGTLTAVLAGLALASQVGCGSDPKTKTCQELGGTIRADGKCYVAPQSPPVDAGGGGGGVVNPPVDAGGGGGGGGTKTCAQVYSCAKNCTDGACVTSCASGTSSTEAQKWNTLYSCAAQRGCEINNASCWSRNCGNEMNACGVAPVATPDAGGGTTTTGRNCIELESCLGDCQDDSVSDPQACASDCEQQSTQEAATKLNAFYQCANQYCIVDGGAVPDIRGCISTNCSAQQTACTSDSPHTGTLSCQAVYICANLCDETDIHCGSDCFLKINDVGKQQLEAMGTCANNASCRDFACVRQYCSAEMTTCGILGTANCSTTLHCIQQAAQAQDDNQIYVCFFSGSAAAQDGVNNFYRCINQFNCRNQACVTQNCSAQLAACQNNTPPPAPDAGSTADAGP